MQVCKIGIPGQRIDVNLPVYWLIPSCTASKKTAVPCYPFEIKAQKRPPMKYPLGTGIALLKG